MVWVSRAALLYLMLASIGLLMFQAPMQTSAVGEPTIMIARKVATITPTSSQSATQTQFGSFVLSKQFGGWHSFETLPIVRIPPWLKLDPEQSLLVAGVADAYAPFTQFTSEVDLMAWEDEWKSRFAESYARFVGLATQYLQTHPDGDGAIPVWMMLGHAHNFSFARVEKPPLDGSEYEHAITLLLERHPERLHFVLDDLIAMGLPIAQINDTDLGKQDFEVLLFSYEFSAYSFMAPPTGQLYALVHEHNHAWQFAPLRTDLQNDHDWPYASHVAALRDLNGDREFEVIVESSTVYNRSAIRLQVFNWRDGHWLKLLAWNPLFGPVVAGGGAIEGEFWFEDLDSDGIQDIVVWRGVCLCPGTVAWDFYQWDSPSQTFTDTLAIKPTHVCGYHAQAEAQRRDTMHDLAGAVFWYEEARRRWLAEMAMPNPKCSNSPSDPSALGIAENYQAQINVENAMSGRYLRAHIFYAGNDFLVGKEIRTTAKNYPRAGWRAMDQEYINLLYCDTPQCRFVGRIYQELSFIWNDPPKTLLICNGENRDRYAVQQGAPAIHVIHWACRAFDKNNSMLFHRDGPDVENSCRWNGRRIVLDRTEVITPSVALVGNRRDFPQLDLIDRSLTSLTSCAGGE